MRGIFSKSFKDDEINQLDTSITQLIQECNDELYLILDDHRRIFQNESSSRLDLATQYESTTLLNQSSFDNKMLRYVLVLTHMFDRIETKLSQYPIISQLFGRSQDIVTTSNDVQIKLSGGVQTYKEPNGQITIKPENRSATLISIILMLYRSNRINDYISNINESIKSDIYQSIQHLIEALNTSYDIPHLDAQYRATQLSLFVHACELFTTWNGDQQTLSIEPLLLPLCDICPVNFELCAAHIILGSIYQQNQSCTWFSVSAINDYIAKYSCLPMTLGMMFNDHEHWSTMYAFASLYSLNFLNLIDTNRWFDTNVIPTAELTMSLLRSRNNAIIFSEASHYYIIEMINGVKLADTSMFSPSKFTTNDNEHQVTAYTIRSPSIKKSNNFLCTVYDIESLKNVVNQLRSDSIESINNTNINMSPSTNNIKLNSNSFPVIEDYKPRTMMITYIFAALTVLLLVVAIIYTQHDSSKIVTADDVVASKSLL